MPGFGDKMIDIELRILAAAHRARRYEDYHPTRNLAPEQTSEPRLAPEKVAAVFVEVPAEDCCSSFHGVLEKE